MLRSKPHIQARPSTCHCQTCDEPDPHCEHGVNLATADCVTCSAIEGERIAELRAALVAYYEDKVAVCQAQADDLALMGRTVQYLDDAGVELEHRNRIGDGTR